MKRLPKLLFLSLLVTLLISACSSPEIPNQVGQDEPAQGGSSGSSNEAAGENIDDDRLNFEIITVSPSIQSPGGSIQLGVQQSISGEVVISRHDQTIITQPFSGSSFEFQIPGDAEDGLYVANLFSQGVQVGLASFRVASQPGVWLSSDRSFISEGGPARFHIISHQLPEDATGAIYRIDQSGSPTPYIPDEQGYLVPGLPSPLAEFLDRSLIFPDPIGGDFEFRASLDSLENSEGQQWVSNSVTISDCASPSQISGTLPGSGYVNTVWLNGQVFSQTIYTTDGNFKIEAGPGSAIIQTLTETDMGYKFDQKILGATCGKEILWAAAEDPRVIGYLPTGAVKTASIGTLGLPLIVESSVKPAGDSGQSCRQGLINSVVTIEGERNAGLSKAAGFALKAALANTSPHASIVTEADIADMLNAAAAEAMENDGEVDLESVSNALATDFLIRLTSSTLGDSLPVLVRSIPSQEGDLAASSSGSSQVDLLVQSSNPIYQKFAEDFSHSAICGEVTPEEKIVALGEQVELTYRVHDLSGENADGAEVTISPPDCGSLDPENGSIEGGVFNTTFTYPNDQFCKEKLEFSTEWDGPLGKLKTEAGEAIARISAQQAYMELSVGYIPGIGNQNANIVEVATVFEDWQEARAPGGLPAVSQAGECKYLEGGQPILNNFWYETVNAPGKRAESSFSTLAYSDLTEPVSEYSKTPVDHFLLRMQTYAYAVPVEDDTPAREASGYAGNGSIISMGLPSTIFVIDIYNPGELPITPIMSWGSRLSNDDGAYTGLFFFKVIRCGTDAGLDSYGSFLSSNIQELYYFDSDEGGEISGLKTLPETTADRIQILLYISNSSIATSIRDDEDGIYHGSLNKLLTEVDVYISQEIGGE